MTALEPARAEHAKWVARVQSLSSQRQAKQEQLQQVKAREKAALVAGDDAGAERHAAEAAAVERRLAVLPAALEAAEAEAASADLVLADALLPGVEASAGEAARAFEVAAAELHRRAAALEASAREFRWTVSRSSYGARGPGDRGAKPTLPLLTRLASGYRERARELRESDL